ncbi:MAG: hypothetical protein R3Y36_01675 [Spirochaetales bacterium]
MDILATVQWSSYAIACITVIFFLFFGKVRIKRFGQCLLTFTHKKYMWYISIIILAAVMLFILRFRDFSLSGTICLHAGAVLAIYISCREILCGKHAGLYENALIIDGKIIKKSIIKDFPTLEYETNPDSSLDILTQKNDIITVRFETLEERTEALKILCAWIAE